jgi:hypothetical protein
MTYEQALALKTKARKVGNVNLTAEENALFPAALEIVHRHLMETDSHYARDCRKFYQKLCMGTGRVDLLKNIATL